MKHYHYNKKIMAAVRVILLAGGLVLGGSIAVLIMRYGDISVSAPVRIAIVASCGALLGLALMLSARPIVGLVCALGAGLKKAVLTHRPEEIAGVALGIVLGLVLSVILYVVLTVLVSFAALNIALTIVAAALFSFIGALLCSRIMLHGNTAEPEQSDETDSEEPANGDNGYILTSGTLFADKAAEVIGKWLTGRLVMLDRSARSLGESDNENVDSALKLYGALSASGKLKTINYIRHDSESADIAAYAAAHRLSVITATPDESALYDGKVKVLCLSAL